MAFLGKDYLLESNTAIELFGEIEHLPIVDPHNHADTQEIIENHHWTDFWEVEGATDHYVWELMRRCGVEEELVTGSASNLDKWNALARVFPRFIGNPTYEWIHLDLKRRFGIDELICCENSEAIWKSTGNALQTDLFKPRQVLKEMNVEVMCTTDDPTLSLPFHEAAKKKDLATKIFPTWRPDKLMNIDSRIWGKTIQQLSLEADQNISTLNDLLTILESTHKYFSDIGCVASDHGLSQPLSANLKNSEIEPIFQKALRLEPLSCEETEKFKSFMLVFFGELNADRGWVMQLHIGPVRDYRDSLSELLGPDTGGDISTNQVEIVKVLRFLLNRFDNQLPIVLYCIDPTHLPTIATITRAFPNVTLGAPWWFNDTPMGMESQLEYIASVDLLWSHAGMVTDSRKLLSFGSRTEMFRRILCNVVGKMIDKGQIPESPGYDLVRWLSYERQLDLFFGGKN